jgi:hypothetical protein
MGGKLFRNGRSQAVLHRPAPSWINGMLCCRTLAARPSWQRSSRGCATRALRNRWSSPEGLWPRLDTWVREQRCCLSSIVVEEKGCAW